MRDAPVDYSRYNSGQAAVPGVVMAEHLRQHLKLVHLRQTMLDHDPVPSKAALRCFSALMLFVTFYHLLRVC